MSRDERPLGDQFTTCTHQWYDGPRCVLRAGHVGEHLTDAESVRPMTPDSPLDTDRVLALADRLDSAPHLTQYGVTLEAIDALRALVAEREQWVTAADRWEKQYSDLVAERQAVLDLIYEANDPDVPDSLDYIDWYSHIADCFDGQPEDYPKVLARIVVRALGVTEEES